MDNILLFQILILTSGYATWFTAGVQSSSLYDNFCKTGNDVIYDVIIWVQDGNCKLTRENFSIGAVYNITKNQDNPIKTVGRDSF